MNKSDFIISSPRGEKFRFLGIRLPIKALQWILEFSSLEDFGQELETTALSLPEQDLVRYWQSLLMDMDNLAKKIRVKVYKLLVGKISKDKLQDLLADKYEFDRDTFLALLDSHVRYFLILIPEITEMVRQYDELNEAFKKANAEFKERLHCLYPKTNLQSDARYILICLALKRMGMKGN